MGIGYISNDTSKIKTLVCSSVSMKSHYAAATEVKLQNACKNMQPRAAFLSIDDCWVNKFISVSDQKTASSWAVRMFCACLTPHCAVGSARTFLLLRRRSSCPVWYKATWGLGICHLFISDAQITASFISRFWHRKAPTAEKCVFYAS